MRMFPTHSRQSKLLIGVVSLVGLMLISAIPSSCWQLLNEKIIPFDSQQIGGNQTVLKPKTTGDLDIDDGMECLELSEETLQITDCDSAILWKSPPDWRVTEAQSGDLNRDGMDEAILLVWRPFKPWPVDHFLPYGGRIKDFHDSHGESCQIILIGWQRGDWRELWAGSALARPVEQLAVADLDDDGWQELVALENDYDSTQSGGQLTVWRWIGFSFSLIDRSESRWERLTIMGDGVHRWLLTR